MERILYLLQKSFEYTTSSLNMPDSVFKYDSLLFHIDEAISILNQEIKEKNPAYYQVIHTTPKYSLQKIRENLSENELLIDFTWHENNIILFALSANEVQMKRIELPDEMRQEIGNYSKYLQGWSNLFSFDEFTSKAREFYLQLLDPLETIIRDKNIYIIPDDSLALLPFETLLYDEITVGRADFSKLPYLIKKNPI